MFDDTGRIAGAQLGFFALLTLPVLFVLVKHRKNGIPGWFFLFVFCTLRVIGSAITINAEQTDKPLTTGKIINQVGLSPLCFALTGIAHEASKSVEYQKRFILGLPLQVLIHLAVVTALPLSIVGSINQSKPGQTPEKIHSGLNLARAGSALFLVVFLLVLFQVIVSFSRRRDNVLEKRLIVAAAMCMPLFLMRILYQFLGAMINSSSWNTRSGGTLAEKIVLKLLPEFTITLVLTIAGVVTANRGPQKP